MDNKKYKDIHECDRENLDIAKGSLIGSGLLAICDGILIRSNDSYLAGGFAIAGGIFLGTGSWGYIEKILESYKEKLKINDRKLNENENNEIERKMNKPNLEVTLGWLLGLTGGIFLGNYDPNTPEYIQPALTYGTLLVSGGLMTKGVKDYDKLINE